MLLTRYQSPLADLRSLLFPLGTEAGLLLDPSDAATGFQESTGTTAGVLDSPTGLRLDKRLGASYGPNLVTNGTFDSVTTGWTGTNATLSVAAGRLRVTNSAATFGRANQDETVVSGKYYRLIFSGFAGTTNPAVNLGTTSGGSDLVSGAVNGQIVRATSNMISIGLYANSSTIGQYAEFDDVSLQLIDGNHVLQATSAARPTWKLNGAIYSDLMDGVDDGYATATFAAGTFTSSMDCFIALKRAAANMVVASNGVSAGEWLLSINSGAAAAGTALSGAGAAWTTWCDNVQIGGTSTTSGAQLSAGITSGAWHVLEVRDIDLSAWTKFTVGLYAALILSGDVGLLALCPAQSAANRARARTLIGAKVGLVL